MPMNETVEDTVSSVCSWLYGRVPRSRVDMFAAELANRLLGRQEEPSMKELIADAANAVHLKEEDVLKLLPNEILCGRSLLRPDDDKKIQMRLVFSAETGRYSPHSHLIRARDFSATRFGSTKLKTLPNEVTGKEEPRLLHSYTSPSSFAYVQLLVHLNYLALGQLLHEEKSSE